GDAGKRSGQTRDHRCGPQCSDRFSSNDRSRGACSVRPATCKVAASFISVTANTLVAADLTCPCLSRTRPRLVRGQRRFLGRAWNRFAANSSKGFAMSPDSARTAFLFPGQGAQSVGMGTTVCAKFPAARALFDEASGILGYDLYKLCAEGPPEKL